MKSSGERLKIYNVFSSCWCKTENSADTHISLVEKQTDKPLDFTPVFILGAFLQQGGVAQIVSHHNGWIQGREIQCGNRNAVIPAKRRRLVSETTVRAERSCTLTPTADVLTLSPAQWQWHQCSLLLLLSWPQASPGPVSWPKHGPVHFQA